MIQNIEGEELMLLSSNRNRMTDFQSVDTGSLPVGSTNIDIEKWVEEFYAKYGDMMTKLANS